MKLEMWCGKSTADSRNLWLGSAFWLSLFIVLVWGSFLVKVSKL